MKQIHKEVKKLDLREGTIAFWVKKNTVKWDDHETYIFFNVSRPDGSIFMVKDADNKLKFFHVILGKGRRDIEEDVSSLEKDKPHFITVTWSNTKQEINLYIDGEIRKRLQVYF